MGIYDYFLLYFVSHLGQRITSLQEWESSKVSLPYIPAGMELLFNANYY